MKKPLFDKYERHIIINCLSGNYPNNSFLMQQYYVAKFKQEIFKKLIIPFCEPIVKFISKQLNKL